MSKVTQVVVWGVGDESRGQCNVDRRVLRVGSSSDADLQISAEELAPICLTLNFQDGDAARAMVYPRSDHVQRIGGVVAELNKGISWSRGERVELVNGYWLELRPGQKQEVASPQPSKSPPTSTVTTKTPRPTNDVEPLPTSKSRASRVGPWIVLGLFVVVLLVIGLALWGNRIARSQEPTVTLKYLLEQLRDNDDRELTIVREQIQLAWRNPQDVATFSRHIQAAREILRRRLAEKVWTTDVDWEPRERVDEMFELQLYTRLSELLE
ncbi:MAG: hypothetical protein Q8M16_05700 [Pirellulaceae bacterium]|nr:hypothetical protein [Pirellulaceae bacterium]